MIASFLGGAALFGAEPDNSADSKTSSIRKRIHKRISEQADNSEGRYYRDKLKEGAYQTAGDLGRTRAGLSFERKRDEEARRLAAKGAISLDDLLAFSLEFNDQVLAARAGLRAVQGEKLVQWSRFLPHVSFLYNRMLLDSGFTGTSNDALNRSIKVTEKFMEFGRESDSTLLFRESQRKALFAYEEVVGGMLVNVRFRYFTILLWQEQIKERRVLLAEYKDRYGKMQEQEKVRRVLEVDVLTSRLNVLHEEARINSLEKELYRQKLELQHAAGFPVGTLEYTLKSEAPSSVPGMEKCVDLALRRSTAVAEARAAQDEQQRVANRSFWELGPALSMGWNWKKEANTAGVSLVREKGTYNLKGFAEKFLKGPDSLFASVDPFYAVNSDGWRFNVAAEVPLFQGFGAFGKIKKERSLLARTTFELRRTVDSVELNVRKAYQNMLEQEKGLEILKETAEISHARLKIQETLKELGKISDNELETFRNRFFDDQSEYYNAEINWISACEELRFAMRWFETDTTTESR